MSNDILRYLLGTADLETFRSSMLHGIAVLFMVYSHYKPKFKKLVDLMHVSLFDIH
jgi:hypothetical protein